MSKTRCLRHKTTSLSPSIIIVLTDLHLLKLAPTHALTASQAVDMIQESYKKGVVTSEMMNGTQYMYIHYTLYYVIRYFVTLQIPFSIHYTQPLVQERL